MKPDKVVRFEVSPEEGSIIELIAVSGWIAGSTDISSPNNVVLTKFNNDNAIVN
jgi:hypothetical protein